MKKKKPVILGITLLSFIYFSFLIVQTVRAQSRVIRRHALVIASQQGAQKCKDLGGKCLAIDPNHPEKLCNKDFPSPIGQVDCADDQVCCLAVEKMCEALGGKCYNVSQDTRDLCPPGSPIELGQAGCGENKICCSPTGTFITEYFPSGLGNILLGDFNTFLKWFLRFSFGISGAIAFFLIIFGAIRVITAAGNPEQAKQGKTIITSALMGLLFIIFSVFLLELIGVKILNLPGLAK